MINFLRFPGVEYFSGSGEGMLNRLPEFGGLSGKRWTPHIGDVVAESIKRRDYFHEAKAMKGARIRTFCQWILCFF